MGSFSIILFEISLPHLHYNVIQHVYEALSVNLCIFCPKLPGIHVLLQCSAMKLSQEQFTGRTKNRIRCQDIGIP